MILYICSESILMWNPKDSLAVYSRDWKKAMPVWKDYDEEQKSWKNRDIEMLLGKKEKIGILFSNDIRKQHVYLRSWLE